jgi:autotransporter-associated beta strand protein
VWLGGSGVTANVWNIPGNWSGGLPTIIDTAQFDNTANSSNLAPSIGATDTSVGAILFAAGTTNAYNISGTATLTLGSAIVSGITNASGTNQTVSVSNITLGIAQTWNVQSTGNLNFSSNVNVNSSNLDLSGSSTGQGTISGVISGAGGSSTLSKSGTGTWTLSGANTFAGNVTVNGGTLLIDGSLSNSSQVFVNGAGSTIGGTGTIVHNLTVGIGANLAPGDGGNNTGILTTSSGHQVTLNPGSNFLVDINGTTAGTGYDRLVTNSAGANGVVLTGSNIVVHVGTTLSGGETFLVINNTGAGVLTGPFAQGNQVIADNGYIFNIIYTPNNGGDVILTFTGQSAVPEPGTWFGGALAVAALAFTQRRRFVRALSRSRPFVRSLPSAI